MSQQRVDHAAEAAVTHDADAADGQGLAAPAAHPGSGRVGGGATGTDDLENPVAADDRGEGVDISGAEKQDADTEGARHVERTRALAENRHAGARASRERSEPSSDEGVPAPSDLDDRENPPDGPAMQATRDEGISRHQ